MRLEDAQPPALGLGIDLMYSEVGEGRWTLLYVPPVPRLEHDWCVWSAQLCQVLCSIILRFRRAICRPRNLSAARIRAIVLGTLGSLQMSDRDVNAGPTVTLNGISELKQGDVKFLTAFWTGNRHPIPTAMLAELAVQLPRVPEAMYGTTLLQRPLVQAGRWRRI